MNPSGDELRQRLSRAVPEDLLHDKEFKRILAEKASATEVSSAASSESLPPPPSSPQKRAKRKTAERISDRVQQRLHAAATDPTRIIDVYDRDMIPHLGHRSRSMEERQVTITVRVR